MPAVSPSSVCGTGVIINWIRWPLRSTTTGKGSPGDSSASPRMVSHFGRSVPLNEMILSPRCKPAVSEAPPLAMLFTTGAGVAGTPYITAPARRSEEHTSELQSHHDLVCRLLL